MSADKPRRLGRGLEALLGGSPSGAQPAPGDIQRIQIARIRPNPFQPRREFDPDELRDLEASIRTSGLLQPVTVRRTGELFQLVAGERRLRAVTNLGWTEVPAIVRDLDDQTMLVLALVENLQRADLNAIEEARGYQRLVDEFGLTQQQVAESVGRDRTTVTNLLRLLTLPEHVQRLVQDGKLTAGHGRALLALDDARRIVALADEIAASGMSVREAEQRVRALRSPLPSTDDAAPKSGSRSPAAAPAGAKSDPTISRIEDDLRRYLQTDVQIRLTAPERGTLSISFYSADDLDRVLELILREKRRDF